MAQPEDVQAGRIYTCNFRKNAFSTKSGDQNVVVIVAEYGGGSGNPRALIAAAEVKKRGQKVNINLDELYTVPIDKLNVANLVAKPEELEGWKAELRNRIDQD